MVNVLNKNLFPYLLFLIITTIFNSHETYSCNITTDIDEQNISIQYQAKTIQDGRIYLNIIIYVILILLRIYCSIYWLL